MTLKYIYTLGIYIDMSADKENQKKVNGLERRIHRKNVELLG